MIFYSIGKEDVLRDLDTASSGLTQHEALLRQKSSGKNKLPEAKRSGFFFKFLQQFKDIMVIILLISAIISISIALISKTYSDLFEGALILIIVILNATMGVVQEYKAENALESLKKNTEPYCDVLREGKLFHVKTEDLVVGDIVSLEAGDVVPADLRLIECHNLKVDEASLTGESLAVEKNDLVILDEHTSLSERKNMVYSSTIITYGRGKGVVIAIGHQTEMGKISVMIDSGKKEMTPLQKSLNRIGKIISIAVLIIAFIIFVIELIFSIGGNILNAFLTSVALAVAAIPESLPAVVTIIMALSVQKLAQRNAIIKRLHAVETLGSCQIICSDKTGTLTQNKMSVKMLYYNNDFSKNNFNFSDIHLKELINGMVLCNDSVINDDAILGDPTETALVNFAIKESVNVKKINAENKRIYELPFDSERKLMTTVNQNEEVVKSYTKGAFEILLKRCNTILINGKKEKISDEILNKLINANKFMGEQAYRVIAIAQKDYDNFEINSNIENDLTLVGLVGMMDPPRPEVKEAIKKCFNASLKPIMITGDHFETAFAVAKELGIANNKNQVINGETLNKMSEAELLKNIKKYTVFARVSPEHKVRIVKAYKKMGKIVAMTGDGINDAASLKIADIGIGMGITGTDVTKDVADMIISDDNFATIIIAVEEGRKIYANIQKTIQFLLSTNSVEVLCLLLSCIFFSNFVFMTAAQLLFINFVSDSLPAISLGLEPAEYDIMERPPRENHSNIITHDIWFEILYQAAIQVVLVMTIFAIYLRFSDNVTATTMAFFTLTFLQIFHAINLKTKHSLFTINPFKNKMFNITLILDTLAVMIVGNIPILAKMFGFTQLTVVQWLIVFGVSISIIPCVEFAKFLTKKYRTERIK